ncbi:MAG: permease-like cell division protein FtsX, partial [Gemmatimonadetes bacterium]|nr:permease-like cell division protein FtsX [Gemmatimonadota bacterium]
MKLVWREALLSFSRTRTLSVLSVTTIAFALFVTGLFGLVALNLRGAINRIEERVEIVAFVLRGTPSQGLAVAMEDIAAFPEVLSVRYVTEEDALAQAKQDLVEFRDAYEDLQINPLPPSIELRLR